MQYRMLYSNDPVELKIRIKLNIYWNNKLKINGEDKGIGRWMCVVDYISKFDKIPDETNNIFLIDTELSENVKNWRQDYMKLLLSVHNNNYKHSPLISIIKAHKMYIDDNNDV